MKVNAETSNIIKIIKNDSDQEAKGRSTRELQDKARDMVSIENKHASDSQVENVEEAKDLLANVTRDLPRHGEDLYNLNFQRIMNLIG